MRVKLLSIFGTRFTYIIQKFLQLPSLLRQLSVIIYSERSGRDSAARNRRRRRRETRARGERRRRRRRDKRASRNSPTVASSALLGGHSFPSRIESRPRIGRIKSAPKGRLESELLLEFVRLALTRSIPDGDVRRACYPGSPPGLQPE